MQISLAPKGPRLMPPNLAAARIVSVAMATGQRLARWGYTDGVLKEVRERHGRAALALFYPPHQLLPEVVGAGRPLEGWEDYRECLALWLYSPPVPGRKETDLPTLPGLEWWPGGDFFQVPSETVADSPKRFKGEPVAAINLKRRKGTAFAYPHQKRDGSWGLYWHLVEETTEGSRWERVKTLEYCLALRRFDLTGKRPTFVPASCPSRWPSIASEGASMMLTDPGVNPSYRVEIEKYYYYSGAPEAVAFRTRIDGSPTLQRWVELTGFSEQVSLPMREVATHWTESHRRGLGWFRRFAPLLREGSRLPPSMQKLLQESLTRLGLLIECDASGSVRLEPPAEIKPLAEYDLKILGNLLERMARWRFLTDDEVDEYYQLCLGFLEIGREAPLLARDGDLTYTISLWRRDPRFDDDLLLPVTTYRDLSVQILTVRLPNGEIVGETAMRLFKDIRTGETELIYSHFSLPLGHSWYPERRLTPTLDRIVREIAASIGIERVTASEQRVHGMLWTQLPHLPLSASMGAEEVATEIMRTSPHPGASLLPWGQGSYEALRPYPGGKVLVAHSIGADFPWDIESVARREVDPYPQVERASEYLWGFSTGTGRSVDFWLGENGYVMTASEGYPTRWYHLNSIGVGRTIAFRGGAEHRDGLAPREGAMRRLFMTNLMHTVAGPLGFRTSFGVAVHDRGKVRPGGEKIPGIPQIQASILELRREQFRLDDLEEGDKVFAATLVDEARQKVARELGLREISRSDYVRWLARTLGEQFAIMEFFDFDHGEIEGDAQLHPGNVSLAAEIFDCDTARFGGKAATRYFDNPGVGENHVDREHIRRMQQERPPGLWLTLLLNLAPDVDFHRELEAAYTRRKSELAQSGIDPRARIRQVVSGVWNPLMRSNPWREERPSSP